MAVEDEEPAQVLPPFDGAGLLQALVRVLDPVPQVLVHEPYEFHAPQLPSTEI